MKRRPDRPPQNPFGLVAAATLRNAELEERLLRFCNGRQPLARTVFNWRSPPVRETFTAAGRIRDNVRRPFEDSVHFQILTIFPEFFDSALGCGLMQKAAAQGLVSFSFVNPRDFATDRHRTVDDRPYGGGPGMVMTPEPISAALESLPAPGRIIQLAPSGVPLTQALAREFAREERLTLLCGRYEGMDARLNEIFPITQVSVGDFVLSGGESAALCVMEAVGRLTPGFMGKDESADEESFSAGLLEYPHYTRPEEFRGLRVPDVLLSGNHAVIAKWRRERSLLATLRQRPELLSEAPLDPADADFISGLSRKRLGKNLHVALVHGPVLDKTGKTGTVSLTNFDIHDIARVSRTYDLGGYYAVTPLADQRALAGRLLSHWTGGPGGAGNPDRAEAMRLVGVAADLDEVVSTLENACGERPFLAATSARGQGSLPFGAARELLKDRPILLILGTGSGLAPEIMEKTDGLLPPVRPFGRYNHLSVRSAASILVDRILGDAY
jgi:tRNA (guanine37-N1)-methyltransferase